MAIKIQGTTVIDDSRNLINITSFTSADAIFSGTGAITLPASTSGNRPATPTAGMLRYNTETAQIEFYNGSSWASPATNSLTAKIYFASSSS